MTRRHARFLWIAILAILPQISFGNVSSPSEVPREETLVPLWPLFYLAEDSESGRRKSSGPSGRNPRKPLRPTKFAPSPGRSRAFPTGWRTMILIIGYFPISGDGTPPTGRTPTRSFPRLNINFLSRSSGGIKTRKPLRPSFRRPHFSNSTMVAGSTSCFPYSGARLIPPAPSPS